MVKFGEQRRREYQNKEQRKSDLIMWKQRFKDKADEVTRLYHVRK
jgi:hypothetical protein